MTPEHDEIGDAEIAGIQASRPDDAVVARLLDEVMWLRGTCQQLAQKVMRELVARTKVIQSLRQLDSQNRALRVIADQARSEKDETRRRIKAAEDVHDVQPAAVADRDQLAARDDSGFGGMAQGVPQPRAPFLHGSD